MQPKLSHIVLNNWNSMDEKELCDLIVDKVNLWGICVLPNFLKKTFCQSAVADIVRLEQRADVKLWQDPLCSDKRIMGVGKLLPYLELRRNGIVSKVISLLYGAEPEAGFTMSGHLRYVEGNLGSGQGWHRDSVNTNQYKSIAYLSDVSSSSGPFQYYLKTANRISMHACDKYYGIPRSENRINIDPQNVLPSSRLVELTADAGTLVFANTRAIHRGKPIESGSRFALTTYHWKNHIPEHIQKLVN